MSIKLEVGRSYEIRTPEKAKSMKLNPVVKIVDCDNDHDYPFFGDDDSSYTENGKCYLGTDSDFDLVREVYQQS